MGFLVSPTEPKILQALGTTAWTPEEYGCDIIWSTKQGIFGIQRKTPSDFLASLQDGRLNKELAQMKSLTQAILIFDGEFAWSTDGNLIKSFASYTKSQHISLLCSIQAEGVWILQARNTTEVVDLVKKVMVWSYKEKHLTLKGRKEPVKSTWGTPQDRDYQLHLLTSLPGIGVSLAEKILDSCGMIFQLKVSKESLMNVPGLGPKKIQKILEILE